MDTYSTRRFALIITGVLGCIFTFFVWRNEIDRNTFLTQSTLDALWSAVLPLDCLFF